MNSQLLGRFLTAWIRLQFSRLSCGCRLASFAKGAVMADARVSPGGRSNFSRGGRHRSAQQRRAASGAISGPHGGACRSAPSAKWEARIGAAKLNARLGLVGRRFRNGEDHAVNDIGHNGGDAAQ